MNTATLAVAGARKTQSIVDKSVADPKARKLVLTYTLNGQYDVERRLKAACAPDEIPEVMGWYSFLLHHWVGPFLPLLYPGRQVRGLNFDGLPRTNRHGVIIATGAARYLDSESRAYKRFLSKLAIDVSVASEGSVIGRLQRVFDTIYIDEVQDLTGYDLDVLELLLASKSNVHLVGDIRQSVFDTNPQDQRNKQFRGLQMIDWFNAHSAAGDFELTHSSRTSRFNQTIATFSDSIFDTAAGFPPTTSAMTDLTDHDGVFAVSPEDVDDYIERFAPTCLRQTSATQTPEHVVATNFGLVKGLTFDRVLIFATGSIDKFLRNGTMLAPKSACGVYVGVTRAEHSVVFVVPKPEKTSLPVWKPST